MLLVISVSSDLLVSEDRSYPCDLWLETLCIKKF
jgi:hypothetical protein